MKIYFQDNNWRGCIVVVAESEEDAIRMMKGTGAYLSSKPIESVDIDPGIIVDNLGDQ